MLYILFGQDDYSLNQSLLEIKNSIGDQALLTVNTTTIDGQRLTMDELKAVCETVPFLAEKRLVIISNLLERFEGRNGTNKRGKRSRQTDQENECKLLGDYLGSMPDSVVLTLIDGSIRDNNPLLKELIGKAEVRSFPLLKGTKLQQWIKKYVTKQGGTISPQAIKLLDEIVGSNLWTMANEIDKLISFTSGRRIDDEDVKAVVSHVLQANVFNMIDAILEFRVGIAQQSLQQLLQQGFGAVYLLSMLSRQVRLIVRAKELGRQKKSEVEIQSRLGLNSEFALRKTLEQAGRYSSQRLRQVYHKLLEADLSIKTGRYDDELTLDILVAELCQR